MVKTFKKGGIHPPANKLSGGSAIENLPLPAEVVIFAGQHLGKPASILVKKGEQVKAGQLIAEASGFISANVHSSVSGIVTKVDDYPDVSGYRRPAVVIQVQGDDWAEGIDTSPEIVSEIRLSPAEIIVRIQQAGIVGMGGAAFPTNVKLMPPPGKKADILIINGAECEPYLTSDHRLMLEHGQEMLIGVNALMLALGTSRAVVGIERNKPDALEHLSKLAAGFPGVEVVALKEKYPQGGEKQLVKAITAREVPSRAGGLPIDVGVVVQNTGTAYAVYQAVQKNMPLVERIVTVTGKSVQKPSNFRVRIGTSYAYLIEAAGGLPQSAGKIVSGGPMMGKAVASVDVPVTKGTSGILLLDQAEASRAKVQNCIRCARCVGVCPMGLEPYLLQAACEHTNWEITESQNIMFCLECGSCSYICPASRPLLDYIRLGKSITGELIRKRKS